MNNREDPDPVRKGTGSSVMYTKYVYRENRNSLIAQAMSTIHEMKIAPPHNPTGKMVFF